MLTAMLTGQKAMVSFTGCIMTKLTAKRFMPKTLICAVSASLAISLSPQSEAEDIASLSVPSTITSNIDLAEIDKRASQLMQQLQMVGLSVAIVENGDMTFAKGYGEVYRNSQMKVTEDTVFRWASVSKGVAAATVLSLQEEGHFELEQPAKLHATSLELPPHEVDVSIEDLLSHRVGIVRNAYDRRIEDGQSSQKVRGALKNLEYLCEPGTCHTYQNVAFDASAEIVETVTGLPYKSVVEERIFEPLEMDTASLCLLYTSPSPRDRG